MRKITYKTLKIQNFLSVGNDTIEINFLKGLNLITGKNQDNPERKNGVGKSVLIDAFYYALFGETIRKIKKAFIVNNVTKGAGMIELTFDVETTEGMSSYKVVRTLKPSAVALYKGDTDITNDSISNTNDTICELIGSNATICKSCDILSLSDNVPFMAKKAEDKRKFIEDIFSLEIYGLMMNDLKKLIKTNKEDWSISKTKIDEMVNSLNLMVKQKIEIEKNIAEKEENLLKRKITLETKLQLAKNEIEQIKRLDISGHISAIEKLKNAENEGEEKLALHYNKVNAAKPCIRHADKQLEELSKGITTCDKCNQDIPHEHSESQRTEWEANRKHYQDILDECQPYIEKLETRLSQIRAMITKCENEVRQEERNKDLVESKERLIRELTESLQNIEEDFKDNSDSVQVIIDGINDSKLRKDAEDKTLTDLTETKDDLETCKFILGEEGVKAFVIKKILGMLNTSIQGYINDLGMTMKCKFDEYFEEQITNDKGKEISYWNFSGGERRTVDLACAWAFKDIRRKVKSVTSNVEFCDEIFDSAFDERGLDLLIEVLKTRIDKNKLSIYAISHRKETMKHIDGEIVMLEKDGGVTRRVDSED